MSRIQTAVAACSLVGCAIAARPPLPEPVLGPDAFLPARPGAEVYATPAEVALAEEDPLRRELAQAAAQAAAKLGIAPPLRDPRLDQAADDIARGSREGDPYSLSLVTFLLAHHGIVAREPRLTIVRASPGTDAELVHHLRPDLPAILQRGPGRWLGIGLHRRDGETTVVLALQEQQLELRPVPRALPARGATPIAARLRAGFDSPQILVTLPDGTVRELRGRARAGWWEAELACRDGDGRYEVEIGAVGARGPTTLALFPVYCGRRPPSGIPATQLAGARPQDAASAERELYTLVNRDRASAGLWPVRRDSRLEDIARAHSREMAAKGAVAHASDTTGVIADRIANARLRPEIVGENIGLAYSAAQAEQGLMASPGHRANIMEARFTTVGIGVVAGAPPPEGGAVQLYVTQIFAAGL